MHKTSVRANSQQKSTGLQAINYGLTGEGKTTRHEYFSTFSIMSKEQRDTYRQGIPQGGDDFYIRCLHKFNWTEGRQLLDRMWVETVQTFGEVLCRQTWGRDGGRGTHVWATERRVLEADRPRFLREFLEIDTSWMKAFGHNKSILEISLFYKQCRICTVKKAIIGEKMMSNNVILTWAAPL